jgi:predicted nucleic acid-binding protein
LRYLLDTNVVSQLTKPQPDPAVNWVLAQEETNLYLSVATIIEIRYGIERRAEGRKRNELEQWLTQELPDQFAGRIVPIEAHVADLAGRIIWRSEQQGWGTDEMDALIAATAMVNDMTLATLNRRHFENLPVALVEF